MQRCPCPARVRPHISRRLVVVAAQRKVVAKFLFCCQQRKESLLQGYQVVKVTALPFPQRNYMSEGSYFVTAYSTMLSTKFGADSKRFLVRLNVSIRNRERMFDTCIFRLPIFVLAALISPILDLNP